MSSNAAALSPMASQPDAGSLRGDDLPRRSFPPVNGIRTEGFAAVFHRSVLQAIYLHGRESADLEVCGVLVGTVGADDQGPFVHVYGCLRGEHAANQAGQVTFTAATWDYLQREMDDRHPEDRIVGWYHTHPDFGIFLSEMDLFIHRHFFDLPWQLALVYDPIRQQEGLFVWRSGKPVAEPYLVHEDTPASELPRVVLKGPPRTVAPEPLDRSVELGQRLLAVERRLFWLGAGLMACLVIGLFWPLALALTIPARHESAAVEDRPVVLPKPPPVLPVEEKQGADRASGGSVAPAKGKEPADAKGKEPAELAPPPRVRVANQPTSPTKGPAAKEGTGATAATPAAAKEPVKKEEPAKPAVDAPRPVDQQPANKPPVPKQVAPSQPKQPLLR
jgi:proteasome lid subunit RPN8/RPN11